MDGHSVVLPHSGGHGSLEKEGRPDTCRSTDGPENAGLGETGQSQKDTGYGIPPARAP